MNISRPRRTVNKNGSIQHVLILLSPNGEILAERDIPHAVKAWNSVSTKEGFDFIVMVDEEGSFFVFEAYYLDFDKKFFATQQKIVYINIIVEDNLVCAVTETGKVILVPIQLD